MTVKRKAFFLIAVSVLALTVGLTLTMNRILQAGFVSIMSSFTEEFNAIERREATRNAGRVLGSIRSRLDGLASSASDWSFWDDTYRFVADRNGEYLKSTLVPDAPALLKANYLLIMDTQGNVAGARGYDLDNAKTAEVPATLLKQLALNEYLYAPKSVSDIRTGLLSLPEGPLLVASSPIVPSDRSGPPRGAVLICRLLDDSEIKRIAELNQVTLSAFPADRPLEGDFSKAVASLGPSSPILIEPESDSTLCVYASVPDFDGKPALYLRVDMPREVFTQGLSLKNVMEERFQTLLLLMGGAVIITGLFLFAFNAYGLDRWLLSRIADLSGQAARIGRERSFSTRLAVDGGDEISTLAGAVNGMLRELETAHRQIGEQEVQQRLLIEKALEESELRFSLFMENLPAVAFIKDAEGRVVMANRFLRELTGNSHWKGKTAAEFFPPDVAVQMEEADRRALAQGFAVHNETVVDAKGLTRSFETYLFTIPMADGTRFLCGISVEVTEKLKLQENLLKTQKLESLGVLAGGIAHDFNNILTAILGNLVLARMELDPAHLAGHLIADCERAVSRAEGMTRQLLTFARGGAPVRTNVETGKLIEDSLSLALIGSNVKGVMEAQEGLWDLDADPGQMDQALHNLIVNARQAMPEGGTVTVSAANVRIPGNLEADLPEGRYVRIAVRDEGHGIPPEFLAKIFDPYFSTREKGSGLGLASAYSIVKRHGGSIDVASSPGSGACFTLLIPAAAKAVEPVRITDFPAAEPAATDRKIKILVMDDEQQVRAVTSAMLRRLGFEAVGCEEGGAAVALFKAASEDGSPFDAVILDLTVPGGMGGEEAARRILEIDPRATLLVSSGYSDNPVVANYLACGFSGNISKPFSMQKLSDELRRALAEAESQERATSH